MLHLLAYQQQTPVTTANDQIPALAGDVFTITNSNFLPQTDLNIYAAMGLGSLITQSRIVTPKLRRFTPPHIIPLEAANVPGSNPNVMDLRSNPVRVAKLEELECQQTHSGTGGDAHGLYLVGDRIQPAPSGNVYTMRGTSSTAAVAYAWSNITMTWPDSLPDGIYACVGGLHFGAGAVASRIIFNGQSWRPGSPSIVVVTDQPSPIFLNGGLGEWGRFEQTALPQIEVLCNATTSTHEYYLQFVQVG